VPEEQMIEAIVGMKRGSQDYPRLQSDNRVLSRHILYSGSGKDTANHNHRIEDISKHSFGSSYHRRQGDKSHPHNAGTCRKDHRMEEKSKDWWYLKNSGRNHQDNGTDPGDIEE